MRALTLDFRRRPQAGGLGIALLLAGVAAVALVGSEYRRVIDEEAQAQSGMHKVAVAGRKKVVRPEGVEDARKLAAEVAHARKLLVQMSLPWNEMFAGVEAVVSRDVGLLRIESDIDRRRLQIDAEAKDTAAMLKYLRAMEVQSEFVDVYLRSHQVQLQDAQHPVRFVLTATWRASPMMTSAGSGR
jgi:Tfp pilus assembly protein PilN